MEKAHRFAMGFFYAHLPAAAVFFSVMVTFLPLSGLPI